MAEDRSHNSQTNSKFSYTSFMPDKNYFFLLFPLLAFLIHFLGVNESLFLAINHSGEALPDIVWETITIFGKKSFVLLVIFLIAWKKPDLLLSVLIASLLAGILSGTLKPLFDLPRPTDVLPLADYHLIGPRISRHSFPSGHTLSAFAVAASIIFYYKKWFITAVMILLASAVGLSRIMLGVHWPIDVLMGATLGLTSAYAAVQFSAIDWIKNSKYKLPVILALYLLLAIKLFWKGTAYPDVQGLVKIVAIAGLVLIAAMIYFRIKNWRSVAQGGAQWRNKTVP